MYCSLDYKNEVDSTNFYLKEESTGTTIIAIPFDGGIVCGADSRATSGRYVVNRFTNKVTPLTDHIITLRSGSQADTQFLNDISKYYLQVHEMETNEPPLVQVAANTFRNLCYKYRDDLLAGIIVAGWDKRKGAQIYNVPLGGMLVLEKFAIGGSGGQYIQGYVESEFKEKMSKEDCINLVINSLALAISKDGASGGSLSMGIITKDGIEKKFILGDELPKYFSL